MMEGTRSRMEEAAAALLFAVPRCAALCAARTRTWRPRQGPPAACWPATSCWSGPGWRGGWGTRGARWGRWTRQTCRRWLRERGIGWGGVSKAGAPPPPPPPPSPPPSPPLPSAPAPRCLPPLLRHSQVFLEKSMPPVVQWGAACSRVVDVTCGATAGTAARSLVSRRCCSRVVEVTCGATTQGTQQPVSGSAPGFGALQRCLSRRGWQHPQHSAAQRSAAPRC